MSRQITRIPSIPISKIIFDAETRHRSLSDNDLRRFLDRKTMSLVTYWVLTEIESESIFEVEKTDPTRIKEIGRKIPALESDLNWI
jgi:hypothetical protein